MVEGASTDFHIRMHVPAHVHTEVSTHLHTSISLSHTHREVLACYCTVGRLQITITMYFKNLDESTLDKPMITVQRR